MSSRPRPGDLIAEAVNRYGEPRIRDWCERLVLGTASAGDAGDPDVGLLGGRTGWPDSWARVWGIRAFRYLAPPPRRVLERALQDPAWRVREHALAVVHATGAGELLPFADAALDDPVPRVRVSAMRVVAEHGESEHAAHLRRMDRTDIPADRLDRAIARMSDRLDRPV